MYQDRLDTLRIVEAMSGPHGPAEVILMATLAYLLAYFVVQFILQLVQFMLQLLRLLFTLAKRQIEIRRLARMSPEELRQWREQEIAKLHARAVRQADRVRDKYLAKQGLGRADYARRLEVGMRGDRGRAMSQNLLDGMDVRGLDLSKLRPGTLNQHIDRAVGDQYTRLPAGLKAPEAWNTPDATRGQPDSDLGGQVDQSGPRPALPDLLDANRIHGGH